jgi:sporulation and cell division protein SsgA
MRQMSEPAATVVCGVTVSVGIPEEPVVPRPAELCYDAADPYAVRLSLGAPESEPVDWVFARSPLEEGLHRPASEVCTSDRPPAGTGSAVTEGYASRINAEHAADHRPAPTYTSPQNGIHHGLS